MSVNSRLKVTKIDVKMDGSVLQEKSSFKMLGLISLLKWIGDLTLSLLLKLPPRKLEVALYLNKSTVQSYMEYYCHVWAGSPSCYLEFLDKLQKWICRTVGPSLAASLELLAHC